MSNRSMYRSTALSQGMLLCRVGMDAAIHYKMLSRGCLLAGAVGCSVLKGTANPAQARRMSCVSLIQLPPLVSIVDKVKVLSLHLVCLFGCRRRRRDGLGLGRGRPAWHGGCCLMHCTATGGGHNSRHCAGKHGLRSLHYACLFMTDAFWQVRKALIAMASMGVGRPGQWEGIAS